MSLRIGVDVGGTHSDAVIMDGQSLLAACKTLTTEDISSGVLTAVRDCLTQAHVDATRVAMITIGTTQFTNAIVRRRDLAPVTAIRIGAQSSAALPVAAKWPADIADAVIDTASMVDGGHEYDGRPIIDLSADNLDNAISAALDHGARNFAITSVFSTSNPEMEIEAARRIKQMQSDARISLSHQLGRMGLYQRENATLLNAALVPLAEQVVDAFQDAFAALELRCPLFISQNDGTLMSAQHARRFPVMTISSGPTNSMRGAAYLTGATSAMVVDVGGTTSDIGMLIEGFPRPSGTSVAVGGVLTNFRMPDVLAIGLGGGTKVSADGAQLGPDSVGRDLPQRGLVFGGDTLTATDIAVSAGRIKLGDPARLQGRLPVEVRDQALGGIKTMLETGIDRMKTDPGLLPLIVVGGGGFLVPDGLEGVSTLLRPENGGVANAIGAAFAQVSGEGDAIFSQSLRSREDALHTATEMARERAVKAGGLAETLETVEIDESPIAYMAEPGSVIRVRVVGDVDMQRFAAAGQAI